MALLALVAGAISAVVVLTGGKPPQRLNLLASNAGQLVKGNVVKVGGVRSGVVKAIDLGPHNQARVRISVSDQKLLPLHAGTRAEIRLSSLSSVAGRYVSLIPGPNDRPPLADGATIPATDVEVPVEIDQLLGALSVQSRLALQRALTGSAAIYSGKAAAANRGLAALNPALTELAQTAHEIGRDDARFEKFLVDAAAVVDVAARHNPALDAGLADAATTTRELADQRVPLRQLLKQAPAAFDQADATLGELVRTGRVLRPALREAQPVAPRIARLLRTLSPLLPRAQPALLDARRLLDQTRTTLRALPALDVAASPAFSAASAALKSSGPIIAGARPFVPDIVHGFFNGFGGQTFTYYDANGHYGRVRPMAYAGSSQTAGALSSILGFSLAGPAERRRIFLRCPGAATDPAPDRSNPFVTRRLECDPKQVP